MTTPDARGLAERLRTSARKANSASLVDLGRDLTTIADALDALSDEKKALEDALRTLTEAATVAVPCIPWFEGVHAEISLRENIDSAEALEVAIEKANAALRNGEAG